MKSATARRQWPAVVSSTCVVMLVAGGLTLGGCATIVNGPTQKVEFASEPPGATVKVDGIPIGITPTSLDLKRDSSHQVSFEKSGYTESEEIVSQKWSWWFAGNVLIGGIIGMIVDASTGDMYNLTPETVSPALIAQTTPAAAPAPVAVTQPAPNPGASMQAQSDSGAASATSVGASAAPAATGSLSAHPASPQETPAAQPAGSNGAI